MVYKITKLTLLLHQKGCEAMNRLKSKLCVCPSLCVSVPRFSMIVPKRDERWSFTGGCPEGRTSFASWACMRTCIMGRSACSSSWSGTIHISACVSASLNQTLHDLYKKKSMSWNLEQGFFLACWKHDIKEIFIFCGTNRWITILMSGKWKKQELRVGTDSHKSQLWEGATTFNKALWVLFDCKVPFE